MRFIAALLLVLISGPALAKSHHHHHRHHHVIRIAAPIPQTHERVWVYAGSLVSSIRAEIGTNPTGWSHNWCAHYLRSKLPMQIAEKVDDRARSFLRLTHIAKQIGAIAVMSRHVGVVSGFDGGGNPIIISGNHGHRVGEGVYSARRVLAYVAAS